VDLGALLSQWGEQGGPADLNGDGAVDGVDLGELLARWGRRASRGMPPCDQNSTVWKGIVAEVHR
jgi:hypothetical protein